MLYVPMPYHSNFATDRAPVTVPQLKCVVPTPCFWFHNHRGNEAWVVTSPSGNQPATLQRKGGDVWAGPDMSVPASISVMAPAAGHVWELGASYTVTFTATGSFDTVVVGVLASHGVASHAQANTRHCLVPAC